MVSIVGTNNITFTDYQTIVPASWLNFINQTCNDIFDVKAYGAKGNGITDDTNAILVTIQAAETAGGGIVFLPAGTYNISSPITITSSNIAFRGAGNFATTINQVTANTNGIIAQGIQGSPITGTYFSDFNISSSNGVGSSNMGLVLEYTALCRVSNIQVTNFLYGVFMEKATNTFFDKVGTAVTTIANGFIGFSIYGSGLPVGGNESSVFRDCYSQGSDNLGSTNQIGFHAYGNYVSDLYFSNCATAETNYGYFLDYSTATAGGYADVIIQNPVVDGFTTQGIGVNALPSGQKLTILGGWINSASTGTASEAIYLQSCVGQISITGTQIEGEGNPANVEAIQINQSQQVVVQGVQFSNCVRAIYENQSSACVYSNNVIYNAQAYTAANMMYLVGTNGSMVIGNSFSGYANSIVLIDNTSSNAGIVGNTASTVSASNRFSNSASNAVGGANGSSGLNIGY